MPPIRDNATEVNKLTRGKQSSLPVSGVNSDTHKPGSIRDRAVTGIGEIRRAYPGLALPEEIPDGAEPDTSIPDMPPFAHWKGMPLRSTTEKQQSRAGSQDFQALEQGLNVNNEPNMPTDMDVDESPGTELALPNAGAPAGAVPKRSIPNEPVYTHWRGVEYSTTEEQQPRARSVDSALPPKIQAREPNDKIKTEPIEHMLTDEPEDNGLYSFASAHPDFNGPGIMAADIKEVPMSPPAKFPKKGKTASFLPQEPKDVRAEHGLARRKQRRSESLNIRHRVQQSNDTATKAINLKLHEWMLLPQSH